MNRFKTALTGLLALGLVSGAAFAAGTTSVVGEDDDDAPETTDAPWNLSLATQVDQQSARGFDGSLSYAIMHATQLHLDVNAVDYTASNPNGFHSQGFEVGAAHDFKRFTIDGGIGRWQDTDILTAKELKLNGEFHADPWSVELKTGYRRSDFDPIQVTHIFKLKDGTTETLNASARCQLSNTALGLGARYDGEVWGASATAMSYQYQNSKCRFGALGLADATTLTKADLRQLANVAVDRLAAVATRRIGRDQTLLDSSLDLGAVWKHGDLEVSADYSRQKEFFKGAQSNTVSTTGTANLGDASAVDVTLGITRGGTVSSGAFVGFAVRAHF